MSRSIHRSPAPPLVVVAILVLLLLPTFLWGQSGSEEFKDLTLLFNGSVQGKIAPCG